MVTGTSTAATLPDGTPAQAVEVARTLERIAEDLERRAAILQASLDRRVVVEQAKGMLAERFGVRVEECAPILERVAASRGVAIHQLARDVLARTFEVEPSVAS
jgi:AmiR/NasT family two-component response regulator